MRTRIHPTACVARGARLGKGCDIGPYTIVEAGVSLGDGSTVAGFCHLGYPEHSGRLKRLTVGAGAVIRSHTVVYMGSAIGPGLRTGHHACIRERCVIGPRFQLGTFGDVQGETTIGADVRTQSHVYICQFSRIEDFVWLFPGAMLANDPHPPSDVCTQGPTLGRFAVVGMGAIVLAGIRVGADSVIAAGAVVREDVPEGQLVAGVPARALGPAKKVKPRHSSLKQVYPWRLHFSRGYPALPGDR